MDFKIDTRDTFSVITPAAESFTTEISDELASTLQQMRQSGSHNFVIDLHSCNNIDEEAADNLVGMHEESYSMGHSLVFTGIKGKVLSVLREKEINEMINIAPKMIEAIDIISMEILERDLFDEEQA
jgi:anti-anti-sigma regulatory factor